MTVRTMPEQRRRFFEQHQRGVTYAEIAEQFGLSKECVRYWCRRQRDGLGCETRFWRRRRGLLRQFDPKVRFAILRLRLEHPRWGPNRILHRLKKRASVRGLRLPSEASIGRYLHQWRRFRRKPKKKPVRETAPAPTRAHQRWQIDFKVGISLNDGHKVNLHSVRDPVGEAYIGEYVFPTGKRQRRVQMEEVRTVLRRCFATWQTLPEEVQTDGESVLIGPHRDSFPSVFTLWLRGLGIEHRVIQNVSSNAAVERCHRTIHDYAVIGNQDRSCSQLQQELLQAVHELNTELPSRAAGCAGNTPLAAHPELLCPRHPFRPEWELARFDLRRVDDYLSQLSWKRVVAKNGVVQLGGKHCRYSLGRGFCGWEVEVRFDPKDRNFVFFDPQAPSHPIKRLPVKELERNDLMGLTDCPVALGPQQLALPLLNRMG